VGYLTSAGSFWTVLRNAYIMMDRLGLGVVGRPDAYTAGITGKLLGDSPNWEGLRDSPSGSHDLERLYLSNGQCYAAREALALLDIMGANQPISVKVK